MSADPSDLALVQRVLSETPAATAGLKGGDVIVEAGDRPVMNARTLQGIAKLKVEHKCQNY